MTTCFVFFSQFTLMAKRGILWNPTFWEEVSLLEFVITRVPRGDLSRLLMEMRRFASETCDVSIDLFGCLVRAKKPGIFEVNVSITWLLKGLL